MVRLFCLTMYFVFFATLAISYPLFPYNASINNNLFNSDFQKLDTNKESSDKILSPSIIIKEDKELIKRKDTISEKKQLLDKSLWKYFRIYINNYFDSLYISPELQNWMGKHSLKENYNEYIDINILNENQDEQKIYHFIPDLNNKYKQTQSIKFNDFNESTRLKLLEWNGRNKVNLENDKWKRFSIEANIENDSLFIHLQDELSIFPPEKKYTINVDLLDSNINNNTITINTIAYPWKILSEDTKIGLITWEGNNKVYFELRKNIKRSYNSEPFNKTVSINIFSPVTRFNMVSPTRYYINPYLYILGGKKLGLPINQNLGFLFGLGNKYSGPFESDQISFGLSLSGLSVNYMTRINGVNERINFPDKIYSNRFNNFYVPQNAWEINLAFPFGSFLEFGAIIPFGENLSGGPPERKYYENNDSTKELKNNIIDGKCFNIEFRYPFRFFEAAFSEIYLAYYAKEIQTGVYSRESKFFKISERYILSDLRLNFTISDKRNFQMLFEWLICGFSDNFKSFAIGPSVRLSKNVSGNFGLHSLLLNARVKIGDFEF